MIVISSIYQKFVKTSLELYRWQFNNASATQRVFKSPAFRMIQWPSLSRGMWLAAAIRSGYL